MRKVSLVFLILAVTAGTGSLLYAIYLENKKNEKSWEQYQKETDQLKSGRQQLANDIKEAAGSRKCDVDTECRVIGMGAKICNGYHHYVVYSTQDAQMVRLRTLADLFNKKAQRLHDLSHTIPKCGHPKPPVRCLNGRCRTKGLPN